VAIAGHITKLETFDPSASAIQLSSSSSESVDLPLIVLAEVAKNVVPVYPVAAKREHIGGTVVLLAILGKNGKISSLDVASSSSPLFSQAATDAVKHWTYQPYLVNGEPVEVNTTITVHFNLTQSPFMP
jgi:TonB family protein